MLLLPDENPIISSSFEHSKILDKKIPISALKKSIDS
jgi:hypothetical protein